MNKLRKLSLGTAQFGFDYGISNTSGRVQADEVKRILNQAREYGINSLDTAVAYGDSEQVLGSAGVEEWMITTKLPPLPPGQMEISKWVSSSIHACLKRLRIQSVYGVLLHRPADLMQKGGELIYKGLQELQKAGFIQKIGISIYSPIELDQLENYFKFDIVQSPLNVFDRRLETSGWLQKLNSMDIEVHARSAFLQGLLLMPPSSRPEKFFPWRSHFEKWDRWLSDNTLKALKASIDYVFSKDEIAKVIVGIANREHLTEIIDEIQKKEYQIPDFLSIEDERLLNPSLWGSL